MSLGIHRTKIENNNIESFGCQLIAKQQWGALTSLKIGINLFTKERIVQAIKVVGF